MMPDPEQLLGDQLTFSDTDRPRMLALAESCGWPRLPVPKRRAGPGPKAWRTFSTIAKHDEIALAIELLEAGLADGTLGLTESMW